MHARLVFAASSFRHPFTHAHHPHGHARDCFGSRRCRGNANSHARGDIHNTMPLITHCLCDGSIPPPFFFLSASSSLRHPLALLYRRYLSRKNTSRIRANHNKICNASVFTKRGVIRLLYYFFIHLIMISFQRRRLAYSFRTTTPETAEGYCVYN